MKWILDHIIAGMAEAGDMEVEGAMVVAVTAEVEAGMEDILVDIIVLGQEDQAEAEITIEEETNDKDFTNPYILDVKLSALKGN